MDELPPYDPAELIPQKGDRAMALAVLAAAREILAAAEFQPRRALEAALRGGRGAVENQGRADVPADSRGGVRPQERAAAV